jgi:hypothetical protein
MEKQKTYSIHAVIILITIFIPALAAFIKYQSRENNEDVNYNKPNLVGIVINNQKIKFTITDWMNGFYQESMSDYDNDHWAYKEKMVRLNNQFYYSAFNQIRVDGFVMGKNNYVFSEAYIYSAFGDNLVDEELVKTKLQKAKVLQDTLKKKGIDLVFSIAIGKGSFLKDKVEDKYKHEIKKTNYDLYATYAKSYKLNFLDLYDYFLKIKTKAKYPLFTEFGHHWSNYGECLGTELMIKYIEQLHQTDLPDLLWDIEDVSDTARGRDADILKSMNLYKEPKQNLKLGYPQLSFEEDSIKNKTKVLVIGDSYWYGPVYAGVNYLCFGNGDFWYYYNKIVATQKTDKKEVWELDLKQEIEKNKVIVLIYSDGNLPRFGNTFIEDAYELYCSPKTYYARIEKEKTLKTYAKQIRSTPTLLKKATLKSKELQITLENAIELDAKKMAGI